MKNFAEYFNLLARKEFAKNQNAELDVIKSVANVSGLSRNLISRAIRNPQQATFDIVDAFARSLNVTRKELIENGLGIDSLTIREVEKLHELDNTNEPLTA